MTEITHTEEDDISSVAGSDRAKAHAPTLSQDGKGEPNPEWEAKADAAHDAIVAEVGVGNPFDTLTMLATWKSHAEPADCDGRISFSRALLDSAHDGLKAALELARAEHIASRQSFSRGAQEMREMLARFVEQGGGPVRGGPHILIAQSLRANWNPTWGEDPGPPRNMRDHGWLGPTLHDKFEALKPAAPQPPESGWRTVFVCSGDFEDPVGDEIGNRYFLSAEACRKGCRCVGDGPNACAAVEARITCPAPPHTLDGETP